MDCNHFILVVNLVALSLNVLSVLLLTWTVRMLYASLWANLLTVPFDYLRLGWYLLAQEATQRPSGWALVGLAAATLVFTGKLAIDLFVVAAWRTWKDVPAWDTSDEGCSPSR